MPLAKPHGTAAADTVRIAVANYELETFTMTIGTQITFPKIALSITVKCSADLATAGKLPLLIYRTLLKAGASAVDISVQSGSPNVASAAGVSSTAPAYIEEIDPRITK
jgi:hypothetical protein